MTSCRKFCEVYCVILLAWGCWLSPARATLEINLNFTSFSTGAPADGSAVLGGGTLAQAQAVIEEAASVWENAFAASDSSIGWSSNDNGKLTQDIAVVWDSLGGSTLATGGTNWFLSDGRWAGGATLTWDSDGSSNFYVDATPQGNSEWRQFSARDLTLNGVPMNVDRNFFDAPAGVARTNHDMLTIAVHEIGHALGFLSAFPAFAASDIGSDSDIDITSGPFNGAEIPIDGSHNDVELETPSGGDFPYDIGGSSIFLPFDYDHSVMGPSIVAGTRKLLTEIDVAIVAEYLKFDMGTVNFNPQMAIPEPGAWAFMSLAAVVGARLLDGGKPRVAKRGNDQRLKSAT